MIKIGFIFFKLVFIRWFGSRSSVLKRVFEDFRNPSNYAIPNDLLQKKGAVFTYVKKALALIWKPSEKDTLEKGRVLLVSNNPKIAKGDKAYVEFCANEKVDFHFFYGKLPNTLSTFEKLSITGYCFFLFPFFLLASWISDYSATWGYMFHSIFRVRLVKALIKKFDAKKLYNFSSFENDANFLKLCLQEIYMVKVPSTNPLQFYYRTVITDELVFTSPYQIEESKWLNKNWQVRNYSCWYPRNYLEVLPFLEKEFNRKYDLAFISSGFWRREERGDNNTGRGENEAETKLLTLLHKIASQNGLRLLILMHPHEKETKEIYERGVKYYQSQLHSKVNVGDFERSTISYFNEIEICIGGFSSVLADRIFMGLKTFYAPLGMQNFFNGLSINKLVLKNEKEVLNSVLNNLTINHKEFFKKRGLINHTHYNYFGDKKL